MINVNYGVSSSTIRSAIVDENMTIREFLNSHDMDYSRLVVSLDAETIRGEALDGTFKDFGIGVGSRDKCYLLCVIKADNAVDIKVLGSTCVVTFEHSIEDIIRASHYTPDMLVVKDMNGEPIYKVDAVNGQGSIGKYGTGFGIDSNQTDSPARVNIEIPANCDPKKFIAWHYGDSIMNLEVVERQLTEAAQVTNAIENEVFGKITVI